MAGFFEKVVWTECTGDQNPQCSRFVNKERLPAYKSRCSDCGSKAREVTKLDPLKTGAVAAAALLLITGGWLYVRGSLLPSIPDSLPGQPAAPVLEVKWSLQTDRNGVERSLSSQDFDQSGDMFTSRESFSTGDRLRLEVSYTAGHLYAFYRSSTEGLALGHDSTGRVTLPASNQWFQLDDHTGMEEFVLVASNQSLTDLDSLTGKVDPAMVDQRVAKLQGKKVSVVRVRVPHR